MAGLLLWRALCVADAWLGVHFKVRGMHNTVTVRSSRGADSLSVHARASEYALAVEVHWQCGTAQLGRTGTRECCGCCKCSSGKAQQVTLQAS